MNTPSSNAPQDWDLANSPKLQKHVQELRESYPIAIERMGPAMCAGIAREGYGVTINNYYLRNDTPQAVQDDFPDDRLVIVLFHEIGHLEYFKSTLPNERNCEDSEYAAFEHSLVKAKELAEQGGDFGPLQQALKHIRLRQQSGKEDKDYQAALNRIVSSELWNSCEKMMQTN